MSDLTILIPAAGASTRMRGADKLLTEIDGTPLLRRTVQVALAATADVLVTLRPQDTARQCALKDLAVRTLAIADAGLGLSASLRGAAAATPRGGLLILPADMPDITTADLGLMIDAARQCPGAILRATGADGTQGHPVLFPADLLPAFATLTGDEGARALLQTHKARLHLIPLPDQHALTDLDTPEAWAAWRNTRSV